MTEKPLSVLFLTRYPVAGASSRYRVFQYIPYLRELGIVCETQSFMDAELYAASFRAGGTPIKILLTFRAVARRIRAVLVHRKFDVIYLQRELLPFGPPILERMMKWQGAKLVFDIDDALFIKKPSRFNPLATLFRSPQKTEQLFRLVDHVITGNDWLASHVTDAGGRASTVEVAEDASRFPNPELRVSKGDAVVIGWLGSSSTAKYLELIAPVLRRVSRKYQKVRFVSVGSGPIEMRDVNWEIRTWTLDEERRSLSEFDIGLMPLPAEDWALGKSGGKARTYMAAGVVPVCSAIGYNRELLVHGRTGFLCTRLGEWYAAIVHLIDNPSIRREIGFSARAVVKRNFHPADKAAQLAEVIRTVASETPISGVRKA